MRDGQKLVTKLSFHSNKFETSRFDDIWCLYHLFKLILIFVSTESPTQHPGNNSRDVLNVTESKKLLGTSMESGKQLFSDSIVGLNFDHIKTGLTQFFSFLLSSLLESVSFHPEYSYDILNDTNAENVTEAPIKLLNGINCVLKY